MAVVTVTITDTDEGGVDVNIDADPGLPTRAAIDAPEPTMAQQIGLALLDSVTQLQQGGSGA